MSEQVGWRGMVRTLRREAPFWAQTLPTLPRLVHRLLAEDRLGGMQATLERLASEQRRRNELLGILVILAVTGLALATLALL
jgi:ubiquinone biosynthesis protein